MSQTRAERGKAIRDASYGVEGTKYWKQLREICPTHADAIHEYVFGTLWDRPGIDIKTRHLLTIALATSLDAPHEVMQHTRGALNFEATQEEIIETILHCAPYIGFPRTNHALRAAQKVFDSWEDESEEWKPLGEAPV
jgi:4-carboxymuconolactone decarboxylase